MFSKVIENCCFREDYSNNSLRPFDNTLLKELKAFELTAKKDYFDAFIKIEMKKGDFLLKQGDVCNHIWFIEEGLARQFLYSEKGEITTDFYFKSEFITLFSSYILKIPSKVNIELLKDSVLYSIKWEQFDELKLKYPILNKFGDYLEFCVNEI